MSPRLTRRDFLERAACAGAALAIARPTGAAPSGMYVCLNPSLTNAPGRQVAWPDFVRLAGKLGYGGVDVSLNPARTAGVEATVALLAEAKVTPAITNLPLQFAAADEAVFQEGLRQLPDNAAFAAAIGLNRMMAVLSPGSPMPKEERWKFLKDRVAAISEVLLRSKIRLGLEFLGPLYFRTKAPHQFIWTLPETLRFAHECGPNIGAVLDAWHWHHSGGTTADIIAAGKAAIVHIHVSDAKAQVPEEVRDNQRHMPGEGIIDLVGFFQALQKIGYEDGVSPEPLGRVPPDMAPEDAAKLALDTTVAMMKKAGVV